MDEVLEIQVVGVSRKMSLVMLASKLTAAGSSPWIDTRYFDKGSVEFFSEPNQNGDLVGSFSAQLMGSNARLRPGDSDDGFLVGEAITETSGFDLNIHCRWLKLKTNTLSVTGAAALSARIHAHNFY